MRDWVKGRHYSRTVVRIIDGDTLVVDWPDPAGLPNERRTIRLAGIDAPELVPAASPAALASAAHLADLCHYRSVRVVPTRTWPDPYNRIIARVYVGATDLSAAQVKAGHAAVLATAGGRLRPHVQHAAARAHERRQAHLTYPDPQRE
jgi:endonuclease YncB( thermonuclease family)